jgi:hypothetical protein
MPSTPLLRMIDAAVNRASEGLRVAEDYVRFVLRASDLIRLCSVSPEVRHSSS